MCSRPTTRMVQALRHALIAPLLILSMTAPAMAIDICVSNASQFADAIDAARHVPQNIELVQGTYGIAFNNRQLAGGTSLRGGYTANCADRDIALGNTILLGNDRFYPLGDLTIEGLTFHSSLDIEHDQDTQDDVPSGTDIVIRRSAFVNAPQGGGISLDWYAEDDNVTFRIVDTVVADNALAGFPAVGLYVIDDTSLVVEMINDTIVDNTQGNGVDVQFDSSGAVLFAYNTILHGNDQTSHHDLVSDSPFIVLVDDVIGTHSYPTPFVVPQGTLTGDPKLDANYRPIESPPSPVINSGASDVHGGLPATDLPGRARIVGTAPDRGAYESSINDGFLQTVTNTNDGGAGSLRSAMTGAISHGSGLISFDIGSGCGPHVITLASALPSVTVPLIINGFTQTGATPNGLASGDDATRCIILESASAAVTRGLTVPTSATDNASLTVKGIGFSGFSDAAINLGAGSGHSIAGNQFGGSVGGHALQPSGNDIHFDQGAHDAIIGGSDPAFRNIIGGATGSGIALAGGLTATLPPAPVGAHDNQIIGNFIGLGWNTANGTATNLGNGSRGINMAGHDNEISNNVIGANAQAGILLSGGGAAGNTITDNSIGAYFGNALSGIHLGGTGGTDAPSHNVITSNSISGNGTEGVWVEVGQGNKIRKNHITTNGSLGIDLAGEGVLVNDDDSSIQLAGYANRGLNTPVLDSAKGGDHLGNLAGTLTTTPGDYTVDVYLSDSCDASGHGEGSTWLRGATVTVPVVQGLTQTTGTYALTIKSPFFFFFADRAITATATDVAGNTSEFSACAIYVDDTIFSDGFDEANL